jgi:hypothetical protein
MLHFQELYSAFKENDENNFTANNILWIFVAHPSPVNGHFKEWVDDYKKQLQ